VAKWRTFWIYDNSMAETDLCWNRKSCGFIGQIEYIWFTLSGLKGFCLIETDPLIFFLS
jgi:hypothetical protein